MSERNSVSIFKYNFNCVFLYLIRRTARPRIRKIKLTTNTTYFRQRKQPRAPMFDSPHSISHTVRKQSQPRCHYFAHTQIRQFTTVHSLLLSNLPTPDYRYREPLLPSLCTRLKSCSLTDALSQLSSGPWTLHWNKKTIQTVQN